MEELGRQAVSGEAAAPQPEIADGDAHGHVGGGVALDRPGPRVQAEAHREGAQGNSGLGQVPPLHGGGELAGRLGHDDRVVRHGEPALVERVPSRPLTARLEEPAAAPAQ
ncbi:hypothetical protein [Streptomyces sp. NPDC057052]|uniref:hypothetical protein n=1 Tax=Streptomyces sp. NPDC057052 TaxID=3346010 RepID=UPI0036445140